MKFHVNENCIGCGLCVSVCPEVFGMTNENVAIASDKETDQEHEDLAMEAKDGCPVSAIEQI